MSKMIIWRTDLWWRLVQKSVRLYTAQSDKAGFKNFNEAYTVSRKLPLKGRRLFHCSSSPPEHERGRMTGPEFLGSSGMAFVYRTKPLRQKHWSLHWWNQMNLVWTLSCRRPNWSCGIRERQKRSFQRTPEFVDCPQRLCRWWWNGPRSAKNNL